MREPRRVTLITGATGFVGSHLMRRLVREGWEVHIVSRVGSTLPDDLTSSRVVNYTHDGTTEGMIRIVDNAKPELVFHLASLFLEQHQPKDIEALIQSNLLFGNQLLEAMYLNGVRLFVNTGTSWQHFENNDYSPVCLYAATKQAFETMIRYYVDVRDFKAITLKLYDTYGPFDPRPKLFSLLEKAAKSGESLAMSGGEQMINLVYIDDVIEAYLIASNRLLMNQVLCQEVYALSSGNPIPLKELVGIYEKVINKKLPIEWGQLPYRKREVMVPWNRGSALPGWKPTVGIEEGIMAMIKRNGLYP